MFNAVKWAQ